MIVTSSRFAIINVLEDHPQAPFLGDGGVNAGLECEEVFFRLPVQLRDISGALPDLGGIGEFVLKAFGQSETGIGV